MPVSPLTLVCLLEGDQKLFTVPVSTDDRVYALLDAIKKANEHSLRHVDARNLASGFWRACESHRGEHQQEHRRRGQREGRGAGRA